VVQLVCVVAAMLVAVPASAHDGRGGDALELCTGIRGNGNRIFAHFGSLARIVEHSGPVRCAAGGSSGSITTFLLESVNRNPVVGRCGRRSCSANRLAERHALLYRSMAGLTEVGIGADVRTIIALVERVQAEGIVALLDTDPRAAVAAFVNVLADFGEIVNPEVFELLAQSPDPAYHVRDLVAGLRDAVGFQVRDSMVFVRVGVINFDVLVGLFGRIGDFYAGRAGACWSFPRRQGWGRCRKAWRTRLRSGSDRGCHRTRSAAPLRCRGRSRSRRAASAMPWR
jgi:hypothetical protein